MPSGTTDQGGGNFNWTKRGGYAGQNSIKKTVEKLEALGFERKKHDSGGSPDGSTIVNVNTFVHPHGHEFYYSTSYGVTAESNRYYMDLKLNIGE